MPCIVCGSRTLTPGCPQCERRVPLLFEPPVPAEVEDNAAVVAVANLVSRAARRERDRLTRLHALGRPVKVGLVSCSKRKAPEQRPARELYQGPIFRSSLAYSLATCDETYILSALHGLVVIDFPLTPYNFTMADLRLAEQEQWAALVMHRLSNHYPALRVEVVGLAGRDYLDPLTVPLRLRGYSLTTPLAGLGIGRRLAWLKRALAHIPPRDCSP